MANDFEMSDKVRIRALYAEIERLRAALNNIVTRYDTKQDGWHAEDMKEIARRALEGR